MEEAGLYRNTYAIRYSAKQNHGVEKEDPETSHARRELIELLERRLDMILERIFWVLGLTYPPVIIMPLYKDLRHEDPNVRINSVELLDNILDPAIKKIVIPIVETAIMDDMTDDTLTRLELKAPNEISSFESLLKGDDDLLKLAVLALIKSMDDPNFNRLLHLAADDDHPRVSMAAQKILAT
jgi:AAA family ATP:ADP antiporter